MPNKKQSIESDPIDSVKPAPEWDLHEARRIVLQGLSSFSCDIYLFGSRAKGTMGRYSDIDIAIDPHQNLPFDLLSELREALEQSHIIYHIDLIDLGKVSAAFRKKVITEGIRWSA